MADDPNSLYEYSQTNIPTGYTSNLQNLGYVSQPFATPDQVFQNQGSFQHLLKRILDSQLQGYDQYGVGPSNLAALPYNMRGMYDQAALAFKDPMYGIIGSNAMFGGGYKLGDLPQNRTHAYETWYNAAHNYPNIPAPNPITGAGSGGSNSGNRSSSQGGTQLYNVPIMGPNGSGQGTIQVVAHDLASAIENAHQGGNTPITGAQPQAQVQAATYREPQQVNYSNVAPPQRGPLYG